MENKKITIITVTKNSDRYLEQSICSVVNQTYDNKELIVVDGVSTDNTLSIIEKYNSKIDKWVSEPDGGIADAMNKGIDMASGEYILFLNSDDYLINTEVLADISTLLLDNMDIYIFKVLFVDRGRHKKISINRGLSWLTNFKMGSCHQGQLYARSLFEKIGKYDTGYKIGMDYEFILRAYRAGATSKSIAKILSVMRQIGISSRKDWHGLYQRFEEERKAHLKYCKNRIMYMTYRVYWSLYLPYRRTMCSLLPGG